MLQVPGGNAQLPDETFDYYCSRVYVAVGKAYETQPELLELRKEVLHAIEHGVKPDAGTDYPAQATELSRQSVQADLKTMAGLNISYDLLTSQSAILAAGLWKNTFETMRTTGVLVRTERRF